MIWREASLYPVWFPLVTGGKTLMDVNHGEAVIHILIETSVARTLRVLGLWSVARAHVTV